MAREDGAESTELTESQRCNVTEDEGEGVSRSISLRALVRYSCPASMSSIKDGVVDIIDSSVRCCDRLSCEDMFMVDGTSQT